MITVTRKIEFDYGHRVLGHEGKCRHLHGHRGVAEITVAAKQRALDSIGRVIDFSCIKDIVGGWIEANWDHNVLLHPDDPLATQQELLGDKQPYIIERGCEHNRNPTAENMAEELFLVTCKLLAMTDVYPVSVRIWETPNCYADYRQS